MLGFTAPPSASAITMGVDEFGVTRGIDAGRPWPDLIEEAHAQILRSQIRWSDVAPTRPTDASDPSDPAYVWTKVDLLARTAHAGGAEPLLNLYVAPSWAEGPNRPTSGFGKDLSEPPDPGSWKPDPVAFKQLAIAVAKRYSGSTPDPLHVGSVLPRIHLFEVWNEPNYKQFLTPQYEKVAGVLTNTVIDRYRALLNNFYDGIKSIQPDATVLSAGLGPYGDSSNGVEVQPQAFLRSLLCERLLPYALVAGRCRVKAKLDGVAHHPYTLFGTPTTKAGKADGGAIGDVPTMVADVNFAVKKNLVLPSGPKPFWVTEFGWMTDPPGLATSTSLRVGINPKLAGIYASEAVYRLMSWKVSVAIWYHLVDTAGWPGGLMFEATDTLPARSKPPLQGFRFPLFPKRYGSVINVWGQSPCTGDLASVNVQTRVRGRWSTVSIVVPSAEGTLTTTIPRVADVTAVRAIGSSLDCHQSSVAMPIYTR